MEEEQWQEVMGEDEEEGEEQEAEIVRCELENGGLWRLKTSGSRVELKSPNQLNLSPRHFHQTNSLRGRSQLTNVTCSTAL